MRSILASMGCDAKSILCLQVIMARYIGLSNLLVMIKTMDLS